LVALVIINKAKQISLLVMW